jgi:putative tryptophan/tyrosine transport system substrate-binding protein
MKRREFITLFGGVTGWPLAVRAQQMTGRIARIAFLRATNSSNSGKQGIDAFKEGLRENGLIDGHNIAVDYVSSELRQDRMREVAEDLARRNLDVIVTVGSQLLRALRATQTTTPIVFAILGDPIGSGLVASLARPGGGMTGLSMANIDLEGKRIEILKETAPAVSRVMILQNPNSAPVELAAAVAAARALAVEVEIIEASDPDQFEDSFARGVGRGANGIAVTASPFFSVHRGRLIELASRHRLPSIWEAAGYVRDGGLVSYGPNFRDMYRRSAGYVAKILNGAKPADLPVEQPTKFELVVNLKTAQALGLTVPPMLLSRADEAIE